MMRSREHQGWVLYRLPLGQEEPAVSLEIDHPFLYAIYRSGRFVLQDVTCDSTVCDKKIPHEVSCTALITFPGKLHKTLLIVGTYAGWVLLLNRDGEEVCSWSAHPRKINSVAVLSDVQTLSNPDSEQGISIVTASSDGSILRWALPTALAQKVHGVVTLSHVIIHKDSSFFRDKKKWLCGIQDQDRIIHVDTKSTRTVLRVRDAREHGEELEKPFTLSLTDVRHVAYDQTRVAMISRNSPSSIYIVDLCLRGVGTIRIPRPRHGVHTTVCDLLGDHVVVGDNHGYLTFFLGREALVECRVSPHSIVSLRTFWRTDISTTTGYVVVGDKYGQLKAITTPFIFQQAASVTNQWFTLRPQERAMAHLMLFTEATPISSDARETPNDFKKEQTYKNSQNYLLASILVSEDSLMTS